MEKRVEAISTKLKPNVVDFSENTPIFFLFFQEKPNTVYCLLSPRTNWSGRKEERRKTLFSSRFKISLIQTNPV